MRLSPKVLGPEAVACLCERPWPGNVRELQNFVRRLAVFCPGKMVEMAHLRQAEGGQPGQPGQPGGCGPGSAAPLAPYKEAKAHVLDGFGTETAILNCLCGISALGNEPLAAALARALNDWIAAEWLDRDPRLRASIILPT